MFIGRKKLDLPHDCKGAAKAVKLTQMVASNWLQPKAQAKSASKPGEKASKPPRRSGSADRSAMGKGLQPLDRIRKEEGRNYTKRSLPHIKNLFWT